MAGLEVSSAQHREVFLNDVQIIITINGVFGLAWKNPDRFNWSKLFPPLSHSPPGRDPFLVAGVSPSNLDNLRPPRDYPIKWQNLHNAIEIIIDLKNLRPYPVWVSNNDDVVLVLHDHKNSTGVTTDWTVTAQGYGKAYSGPPLTVPVEAVPIIE